MEMSKKAKMSASGIYSFLEDKRNIVIIHVREALCQQKQYTPVVGDRLK